jgi:hypothetical protein
VADLAPKPAARPSMLEVFAERCKARARLWQAGEMDLHTAVDELQAAAVRDGLVAQLGQDEVQRLMADAFTAFTNLFDAELWAAFVDEIERVCDVIIRRPPSGVQTSTRKAAEYLAK